MSDWSYHVYPRYTPGSPAMVDVATAERVARQEREAFADCDILGMENKGLSGIVLAKKEARQDRVDGWEIVDLITDERCFKPGAQAQPSCREDADHKIGGVTWKLDENGNLRALARCELCGIAATSLPLLLNWDMSYDR